MLDIFDSVTVTLDNKNRVPFPSNFKRAFIKHDVNVMILIYIDGHIVAFTSQGYKEYKSLIDQKYPVIDMKHRKKRRYLLGDPRTVQVDSMGRIVIPQYFKEECKIDKKVFIRSVEDQSLEIWAKEVYDKLSEERIKHFEEEGGIDEIEL